jgi:hypothetical protein
LWRLLPGVVAAWDWETLNLFGLDDSVGFWACLVPKQIWGGPPRSKLTHPVPKQKKTKKKTPSIRGLQRNERPGRKKKTTPDFPSPIQLECALSLSPRDDWRPPPPPYARRRGLRRALRRSPATSTHQVRPPLPSFPFPLRETELPNPTLTLAICSLHSDPPVTGLFPLDRRGLWSKMNQCPPQSLPIRMDWTRLFCF